MAKPVMTIEASLGPGDAELVIRVTGPLCLVQDAAGYCQAEIARIKRGAEGRKPCGCGKKKAADAV